MWKQNCKADRALRGLCKAVEVRIFDNLRLAVNNKREISNR